MLHVIPRVRRTIAYLFLLMLAAPSSSARGQSSTSDNLPIDRPLTGFRYLWIEPIRYEDGRSDDMNLKPYLQSRLGEDGWIFPTDTQFQALIEDAKGASATLVCNISHAPHRTGSSVTFLCFDLFRRGMFSITETGYTGYTQKGNLEAALRDVAKKLRAAHPRYEASTTVDLATTLAAVDTMSVTEDDVDRRIAAGELSAPVEGIWSDKQQTYNVAILPAARDGEYVAVMLKTRNPFWKQGMIKARLTSTVGGRNFLVQWADASRRQVSASAELDRGSLTVNLPLRNGQRQTATLVKIRPIGVTTGAPPAVSSGGSRILIATGTGFVTAPRIVATNQHVIRGASAIELYLPDSNRVIPLEVVVTDPVNDLALLRPSDAGVAFPEPMRLTDSVELKLGQDAVVLGFPLGSVLGASHKVTTGVVSALDGLAGDPRMFQLTAPIQPGSSGSPVFEVSGGVIGIVTATLDSVEGIKADGQVPQNVNFALKADYLQLLLKRAGPPLPSLANDARRARLSVTQMVDKTKGSVGQVRAYR